MKNKIKSVLGVVFIASSVQISNVYAEEMQLKPSSSPMTKNNMKMMSDADILSLVMTVDTDEIDAAKKASAKNLSKDTANYAQMMIQHHTMNLEKDKSLAKTMNATLAQTKEAAKMHKEDAQKLAKILKMNNKEFEKAYLDFMVKGHSKVLKMLNTKLIPAAKNEELKKHLEATQKTVSGHLTTAQTILKNLKA